MIKKVLIIRFRRIGDAVLSTVLCSTIRKNFPEAEVHYLLHDPINTLFEYHPDIDKVISFPAKDSVGSYLKRVWRLMRKEKYDAIIDTRATFTSLCFSWFSFKTKYRIGTRKSYSFIGHNYRIANQKDDTLDEVSRNLLLLKPLERLKPLEYVSDFRLFITSEENRDFHSFMEREGIDFSKPVIVCTPFTRVKGKAWSMERMKKVLRLIIETYDAQLIFNYNEREKEAAFRLFREMGEDEHLFIHIEADSIRKLGAMCLQADFFFGNEGGPRHIAQALNIPGFAIYPPWVDKTKWLPNPSERYQGISPRDVILPDEWQSLTDRERFERITVKEVWARLRPMLDKFLASKSGIT